MNRDKDKMLKELMQLDFRIYDLQLYLDTHPCDTRAINEYNETSNKACLMRQNFENLYYPLTVNYNQNKANNWQWIEGPWPWENENQGGKC